ncbi:hypothetical protein ALC53_02592 [Atta colombica]|uniref:Uncharacterized protein n=1 Tax=Atta colombica TaxID=520822 RepID=A0A195BS45_9HYME|nr:hypothetical protein ALC53_02592 [Atta colombica]
MVIPLPASSEMAFRSQWLVDRLMQKMLRPLVTANRDVLEIRETAPGMGNVRRENERKPALNIERGLNSKISLSALSA